MKIIIKPKSETKALLFFLFFALFVWPFHLILFQVQSYNHLFKNYTVSKNFQKYQNQNYDNSCQALPLFQHIDILIIGSSHAGRGVSVSRLGKIWPKKTLALCVYPAWNIKFLQPLFDKLEDSQISVGQIIWLADFGALFESYNLKKYENLMQKNDFKNISNHFLEIAPKLLMKNILKRNENKLQNQSEVFSDIDPLNLQAIASSGILESEISLIKSNNQKRKIVSPNAHINFLCKRIEKLNISLNIVVYPLLPRIENHPLITNIEDTTNALKNLISSAHCATKIVDKPFKYWDLDLRHFINLNTPNAAEIFNKIKSFSSYYSVLNQDKKYKLWDPNHLNLLGS
ncbi:hypothetical protein N8390_10125, partial [Amylibacter sp.]|nr:hypothetical protein [Amylibacter sp.]